MELSPGIVFTIVNAPHIVLLPVLTLCGDVLQCLHTFWFQPCLCIASLPLSAACSVWYVDYRNRRNATMNGAILAPQVHRKWRGGLDLLFSSLNNFRGGCLGMPISL
ncbi:hypothetical protein JVU11DRAFT_3999 [Chiua virens]|nr:hypothetical protein JVU11DRAFT_3999 [Chiua virens]